VFSGDRYRLKVRTLAVVSNQEDIVDIPAGDEIVVLPSLDAVPLESMKEVDVEWRGRKLRVFAVDLHKRGERQS
jgi:hypothetical protein